MKKLLSVILCVALMTGVCAAASAEKKLFEAVENEDYADIVSKMYKILENAANSSNKMAKAPSIYGVLRDFLTGTGISDSINAINNKLKSAKDIMSNIKNRDPITEDDFDEAVIVAKKAVSLIPSFQEIINANILDILMKGIPEYYKGRLRPDLIGLAVCEGIVYFSDNKIYAEEVIKYLNALQ